MSNTTYSDAVDSMFAQFVATWEIESSPVVGYVPEIRWQGKEKTEIPDKTLFWIRLSTQLVLERQSSLSTDVTGPGKRQYESSGLIFVQLFCPKTTINALYLGRLLAQLARNVFRRQNANVTYRNARINDNLESEQDFHRINVVAEFEFNEIV